MYIHEKLEQIRKKPEHIRERYLWIAVGISMLIIFIAWMISIRASFQKTSDESSTLNLMENINNAKNSIQEKPSLPESGR